MLSNKIEKTKKYIQNYHKKIVRFFIVVLIGILTVVFYQNQTLSQIKNVKIIEWGWGTPFPTYVKENIREMEKIPFDGIVLDLKINGQDRPATSNDTGNRFSWNVWGVNAIDAEKYSQSINALNETDFERFTDNFLRFNVTPGDVDWYDESFQSVIDNARLAARITRESGLKGILLDTEEYYGKPFRYLVQARRSEYSFPEYQKKVKQRGREFMQAMNQIYPNIKIILTFGYNLAYKKSLKDSDYGLLPSFLDGLLEAANPENLVFDGWEQSYAYQTEEEFQQAYDYIYNRGLETTSVKDQFREHYRASFGLWIDQGDVWDRSNFNNNYFTPESFEKSLGFALKYTDRYVWIYSHHARWWAGQVPEPYIEALNKARN